MTHPIETILAAVLTKVTGLTTTGTNVFRGKGYRFLPAQVPGLAVFMGEENVAEVQSHDRLICELEVFIDLAVAEPTTITDTTINAMRKEITIALAADYTLGLAFVSDFQEIGGDAPDISGEADRPAAVMRFGWLATYQRNRTTASPP